MSKLNEKTMKLIGKAVKKRIDEEIHKIRKKGFDPVYILMSWESVKYFKKHLEDVSHYYEYKEENPNVDKYMDIEIVVLDKMDDVYHKVLAENEFCRKLEAVE